jgi:Flp pilus assembly protein TadB
VARTQRRRKRRGTQAGTIDRRARSRPRSRQEARARARQQTGKKQKRDLPPTWGSAVWRGLFAAAFFFVLIVLLFGQAVGPSLGLAAVMLLIYIPLGHYIDGFMYRRRQAARLRERERKARGG